MSKKSRTTEQWRFAGDARIIPGLHDPIVEALVTALEHRDHETCEHSIRVTAMTLRLAADLGIEPEGTDWDVLRKAAMMHDIGKINVPDAVLLKPDRLLPDEWREMQRHPGTGYEMLADVPRLLAAAAIVRTHHERWDGRGYPLGLAGEDIPLGARIFALADAFDAMTSNRPYRQALPPDWALREIQAQRGSQFEPRMVEVFESCYGGLAEMVEGRGIAA